ncbi:hypothetical protein [Paenibacillus amylolyticus]|uniref:hypothetical protein n=1 Tax=Paenibacillus amylolyticus TaxID=1451 RepID=UPI00096D9A45|nr:hypothetical protein [Paenibacillus amylolyticus]
MDNTTVMTPKDAASQLHELVKHIKAQFDNTVTCVGFCDGEATDLSHAFEFLGPEEVEPEELMRQYQANRRTRRRAKEANEQWRVLHEIVVRLGLLHEFSQGKREIRSVIKTQAARHYTVRSREDLQNHFDRAKLRHTVNTGTDA